jgi:hypothetical protein
MDNFKIDQMKFKSILVMQIFNTKFTLNLFSYTNTAKHEKNGHNLHAENSLLCTLCQSYIYLSPAHLSIVDLPVYIH